MTNNITPYNPIFYAQEGLLWLEKALGMAGRVYRGFDPSRSSATPGDTIKVKRPGVFTTQAGGTGTLSDIDPDEIQVKVDTWREVKFGLTDQELATTGDVIISDHIRPAAYALAAYIDTSLTALYKYVGWSADLAATISALDIINPRKVLRDQVGPLLDTMDSHYAIDATLEASFLNLGIFHQAQIAGETTSQDALLNGSLGRRFGVEFFVNQTLPTHTSGTVVSAGTDVSGTLTGDHSKGAEAVTIGALSTGSPAETLKAGDSFVIAGHTQRYVVTADVTLTGGSTGSVAIWPPLVQDYSNGAVVTFEDGTVTGNNADSFNANLMFHRNAFCLVMAPLPEIGDGAGAKMSVVTDPQTGLSIRSRLSYDDTNAKVIVTLDVLFGVKCLDPNLAVVCRRA